MPEPLRARERHRLPGRVRLVLEPRPDDVGVLTGLADRLAAVPGLREVTISPITSSIVLQHDGPWEAFVAALRSELVILPPAPSFAPDDPAMAVAMRLAELDAEVTRMTGGRADLWQAAFVGLVAAGLVQLARGQVFGPALTLFAQAATLAMSRPPRRPPDRTGGAAPR